MKKIRNHHHLALLFFIIVLLIACITGYPTARPDLYVKPEEHVLPNGTVLGKYLYMDKEGNPIQVKYYADEQSYGVELSSVKVVSTKAEQPPFTSTTSFQENKAQNTEKTINNINTDQYDPSNVIKFPPLSQVIQKNKIVEPLDYLNKEPKPHQKNKYKNPDYEVFIQNDLSNNKHCLSQKDKVRVYSFDSEQRKAREVGVPNICEQF